MYPWGFYTHSWCSYIIVQKTQGWGWFLKLTNTSSIEASLFSRCQKIEILSAFLLYVIYAIGEYNISLKTKINHLYSEKHEFSKSE